MKHDDDMRGAWLAWAVSLLLVVASLAIVHGCAHARDLDGRHANSPLHPWFDQLRSQGGALCCSDADGIAVSDPDWDMSGGHYRVKLDGNWMDVPDDAVVTVPNRAGRTMVWPYRADGKVIFIRCFMPGIMS